VQLPKQIKDVFEEFTQMYEKLKRNSKNTDTDPKSAKQKAIILTWNIDHGSCEIKTYRVSDQTRKLILLTMNCKQGLILLQFTSPESRKSPSEIAKSLSVMTSAQVT